MSRFLRAALIGLLVLGAVAAAGGYLLAQDPNRFKPELQAIIREQAGVPVSINGDLSWRLWPPVSLSAADVNADYQGRIWQIGRLSVDLNAWKVLRDPQQWDVQSFSVADVTLEERGSVLEITHAQLDDLAANRSAPFRVELRYTPGPDLPPIPLTARGRLAVDPKTLHLALDEVRLDSTDVAGTCNLQAQPLTHPGAAPVATAEDLIPLEAFRGTSWAGHCLLDRVTVKQHRFDQVTVDLANDGVRSQLAVTAPRFFGGSGQARLDIDVGGTPVGWALTPTFDHVDSSALLAWLDQDLAWAAPLAYGGTLSARGNTQADLLASLSGETRFDGGQGSIDISEIRRPLIALASTFNEGDRIRGWPEVWDYQRFVGTWRIDGEQHRLDAALDNLHVDGAGRLDPVGETLDMRFELTFTDDPDLPVFDLDPVLYDLPIPVHCRGAVAEPECGVDPDAAQRIVAQALSGDDSRLRSELEKKIDEQVPEQYRDAARSLLDALGSSRRQPDSEPR